MASQYIANLVRACSSGTDRRNDGNFVAFLYCDLIGIIVSLGNLDIVEVDSHEARVEDLGFNALVFLFQSFKEFTDGQGCRERLVLLGSEGTGTCEVEDTEVSLGRFGGHDSGGSVEG